MEVSYSRTTSQYIDAIIHCGVIGNVGKTVKAIIRPVKPLENHWKTVKAIIRPL